MKKRSQPDQYSYDTPSRVERGNIPKVYNCKLLIPGGIYHEEEVSLGFSEPLWLGADCGDRGGSTQRLRRAAWVLGQIGQLRLTKPAALASSPEQLMLAC